MLRRCCLPNLMTRIVVLVCLALTVAGCSATYWSDYPSPPPPLRPTVVGVIQSATADDSGYHTKLTDGRVIDQPNDGRWKSWGPVYDKGDLFLAGDGFSTALLPFGDGCWEAWYGGSRYTIAWDEGDRVLFEDGIELPKAPGFTTDQASQNVNGKLAWTNPNDRRGGQWMSFCANSHGQIVSGKLNP